jgi:predicted regulator of Ras-like GTPase activity (Roadblock/LC7/MglB family)
MELKTAIDEILNREPSVKSALILDKDGIVILEVVREDYKSAQELAIEYATALQQIIKVTDVLSLGELEEILVSTDKSVIVIRLITRNYYLILVIDNEGNIGKAKYLAKRSADIIRSEFV